MDRQTDKMHRQKEDKQITSPSLILACNDSALKPAKTTLDTNIEVRDGKW